MTKRTEIRRNAYHDSVQLMLVSKALRDLPGVTQAYVAMGTDNNKRILEDLGLSLGGTAEATANDLIVALDADNEETVGRALSSMDLMFVRQSARPVGGVRHRTFAAALRAAPDANLCVISVPGRHAAAEARKALEAGLHVVIFSDDVPFESERELKEMARARKLLCMGPDCGVANINGVALLTGSVVRRGPIGVIGASGSGLQQITVIADREGIGVSQAIGVGGRDLNDAVGGIGMLTAMDALEEDPETKVLVLVSRKPGSRTWAAILDRVRQCAKPVVGCFIGGDRTAFEAVGGFPAVDLEDAARKAIDLAQGRPLRTVAFTLNDAEVAALVARESEGKAPGQRYLRGLFCGGTFCEEAIAVLSGIVGDIHSNAPLRPELRLRDSRQSVAHSIVDFGAEEFTRGRPHPVIDPEPRRQAILKEGSDPEVAVILLDFILSFAVHPDPAGAVADAIRQVKDASRREGRPLSVIASVCGTEADPQRLSVQERTLRESGVVVMPTNVQAARLAGRILRGIGVKG